MRKLILAILVFNYSCGPGQKIYQNDKGDLNTEAFCTLMKVKHGFDTPNNLSKDTLLIYDQYYVDTFSLYYYQYNLGFELRFLDTGSFKHVVGDKEDWLFFREFSALRNRHFPHETNSTCFDTMKVKFVSQEALVDKKIKDRVLYYSPLIKNSKDTYSIYEQWSTGNLGAFYHYSFKRVDNEFEFVKRYYHSDVVHTEEDYMSTINFDQTYEEFMESRKYK